MTTTAATVKKPRKPGIPKTNLEGRRVNYLVVTGASKWEGRKTKWLCRCEAPTRPDGGLCHGLAWVQSSHLVSESVLSCGCLRRVTHAVRLKLLNERKAQRGRN